LNRLPEEFKKVTEAIAARNKRYFLNFKAEIKALTAFFFTFSIVRESIRFFVICQK